MEYPQELIVSLQAFGLTAREATIYLAGIELGPTTILELSRRTSLPRTTLYPILEHLCAEHVFQESLAKGKTVYTAASPQELAELLAEKEKLLQEYLPQLEALNNLHEEHSDIMVYQGTEGFKQLWKSIFRSGVTEYRIITHGYAMLDYVKEPYLVERVIAERVRRGIKSLQLIPENKAAREIIKKDPVELRESRFLPSNFDIGAAIVVFGDEVAFITSRKENAMVVLASGDVAKTHRALFDVLWQTAKPAQSTP